MKTRAVFKGLFASILFISTTTFGGEKLSKVVLLPADECGNKIGGYNGDARNPNAGKELMSTTTTTVCASISVAMPFSTTTASLLSSVNLAQADAYARASLSGVVLSAEESGFVISTLQEATAANLVNAEFAEVSNNQLNNEQLQFIVMLSAAAQ